MTDDLIAHYDSTFNENLEFRVLDRESYPTFRGEFAVIHAKGGTRVLDLGCGLGEVLYNLKDRYQELHGIDISKPWVEKSAQSLAGLNAFLKVGEIGKGDCIYPDDYFDTVTSTDVIEHVIDVKQFLREIHRILKPGGALVLTTPNFAKIKNRLALLFGYFPSTSATNEGLDQPVTEILIDGGHLHYFTFRMLRLLANEARFNSFHGHGIGRFRRLHNVWPPLLSPVCAVVMRK